MKKFTLLITLFLACNFSHAQIVAWSMNAPNTAGDEPTLDARTLDPNLNMSTLSRGAGIDAANLVRAFSSDDYTGSFATPGTQTDALTNDEYFQFEISSSPNYEVSLSTLDANFRRSNIGPNTFLWRYSIDGVNFTDIGTPFTYLGSGGNGQPQAQIDLSVLPDLQNVNSGTTITFRLYGWGARRADGTFAIGRRNGNELTIGGSVVFNPCSGPLITWDGITETWSNDPIGPTIANAVEINGIYDTVTHGNFSACNLTINSGAILTVSDTGYVEVENNLTVNAGGTIDVEPYGNFIQNSDSGISINDGTITVDKLTAPLNNWYEYTYWSSPVSNATVGVALTDADADRRFRFNGNLFNDEFAEVANDNSATLGQDDIDDEGDDWEWVSGAAIMEPGVGYAATHSEIAYVFPGANYRYTFEGGTFNNGVINVPVFRNDVTALDFNWNFIGNPYPSAVDINAFMTQNIFDAATNPSGTLEGAIYFWSQDTDSSATTNGNEALNFDTVDYATHNGVGGTVGGDGLIPNGFIPSGQGFFVSFSDGPASSTGTVVFNNAMRSLSLSPDNSQFFRNANTKKNTTNTANKLWVNLTSDNGVFNQILVGYVNGATQADDGAYYDARKIVAPTAYAALYSTIEGTDKKFAIQGKAGNSLNENEIIKLGFSTNIDVPTIYKLSLDQFEGDFLTANTVYLKDNLLNELHNLSASDYSFTSEIGEFNNRFVIQFTESVLSTNDIALDSNTLKIIEREEGQVEFKASKSINTVSIFDLLGRQLYAFKGQTNSETYNLSNLNRSVYIAKVALSDGTTITKKAFKK